MCLLGRQVTKTFYNLIYFIKGPGTFQKLNEKGTAILPQFLLVLINLIKEGITWPNPSFNRNIPYLSEQGVPHVYNPPNRNDHYESLKSIEEEDESRVFISWALVFKKSSCLVLFVVVVWDSKTPSKPLMTLNLLLRVLPTVDTYMGCSSWFL